MASEAEHLRARYWVLRFVLQVLNNVEVRNVSSLFYTGNLRIIALLPFVADKSAPTCNTIPCSVPTRYLVGPASWLYSIELPPSTIPPPLESVASWSVSVGSPNRRVSHHIICPSVDTDAHWLPVSRRNNGWRSTQRECHRNVLLGSRVAHVLSMLWFDKNVPALVVDTMLASRYSTYGYDSLNVRRMPRVVVITVHLT